MIFRRKSRQHQTKMNKTRILDEYNKIKNWCVANNLFFLKADIQLPETVLQEAMNIYDAGLFVDHKSSISSGWRSATLHGEGIHVTMFNPDAKCRWTELVDYAPTMTEWLKHEFPHAGSYARCRFMLLEPGGFIKRHTDTPRWKEGMPLLNDVTRAVNISITQPENCYLRNADTLEEVPFRPRDVFWFNNGPYHEAANNSKEPRIHFIVHGGVNTDRMKLFIDSFRKEHPDAVL